MGKNHRQALNFNLDMPEWAQRRDLVYNQTLIDVALLDTADPMVMWETLQLSITDEAKQMTADLKSRFKDQREPLRNDLDWHLQNQAKNPEDPGIEQAIQSVKRKLTALSAQQSDASRSKRMNYGLNIADHVHPAFLRRASGGRAKSFIPDLEMHDQYFSSEEMREDSGLTNKTSGEQQKIDEARKFHEQLIALGLKGVLRLAQH